MPLNDPNDPLGKQCRDTSVSAVWEGGWQGDNDALMVLSLWEDVPNGTVLFTAWPGREQHGERVGGKTERGINRKIICLHNFYLKTNEHMWHRTLFFLFQKKAKAQNSWLIWEHQINLKPFALKKKSNINIFLLSFSMTYNFKSNQFIYYLFRWYFERSSSNRLSYLGILVRLNFCIYCCKDNKEG